MDLLNDLLDKALECPVCLEQLDASARVLPCQHTFCRRCLLEIIHSRRELLCPECRVQCDQSVDELPSNILLIRLLEGIKSNRIQSTDRNNGQNVNDLLELSSQTSGVGTQSTAGLSINQSFCSKQIISQTTPHSQPNQSQSPQTSQSKALPQQSQQISIKHPLPAPPQQQTNQNHTQSQQPISQSQQMLTQQQQCLVKQLIQTPNSLPGVKSLYSYDGKDLEDYVALYNYKPQKADELELKKGELYSVYKKCHDGWYKGVSVRSGTSGVFPGNYVQLVKSCVQIAQYGCPVGSGTSQSRPIGQPLPQSSSMVKEPPLPKPKPILPLKPSISLSSGVTPIESSVQTTSPQSNSATENAIVYARPRPTGQPLYDVSRNINSLVPPPPPPQRPTRPLSSILVPNTKSNDESSAAAQLAHTLNQSLLISKPQSVSQSSLNERTSPVWHQPKVAATRNTISMVANTSTLHSAVTAITPPPNVSVMSSSSALTPTSHRPPIDRKESKSKEKSNFIKRFTSSSKRKHNSNNNNNNNNNNNSNNHNNSHNNVSNISFSCDNPSFVDTSPNNLAPIHIRSGSCPNESLTDFASHKKQSSFDDSNTVIKNRMAAKTTVKESPQTEQPVIAPPLVRERFRCVVPYPPNSEYELELKIGDIVYVHKKREDGWFKGTLQRTGKTGLFPGPFVETF